MALEKQILVLKQSARKSHLTLCSPSRDTAQNNIQFNLIRDEGGISPKRGGYCTLRGYPDILSTLAALSRIINSLRTVLFSVGTVSHCARHAILEGRELPLWDSS